MKINLSIIRKNEVKLINLYQPKRSYNFEKELNRETSITRKNEVKQSISKIIFLRH